MNAREKGDIEAKMVHPTTEPPVTDDPQWQVQILLKEYDNLSATMAIMLRAQYTVATIGATLPLGVVLAAGQFDEPGVALVLPVAMALIACLVGIQQTMLVYREEHLATIESKINQLCCGRPDAPLLTWYATRNDARMERGEAPATLWLWIVWPTIVILYGAAVIAGVIIELSGVPGPVDCLKTVYWRCVGAGLFAAVHLVVVWALIRLFLSHRDLARAAYNGQGVAGWRGAAKVFLPKALHQCLVNRFREAGSASEGNQNEPR